MIASIFNKSKPINYILVSILMVLCFITVVIYKVTSVVDGLQKVGLLILLVAMLFITDFISRRNNLTKDSSYSLVFFLTFLLFIPSCFDNANVIISSFFIVLAIRRLIAMQSMNLLKEKIFDASLWIFVASLFHFWSILFIVLVFISIVFHVAGDYRNWILPFIAFFAVMIVFLFFSLILDKNLIEFVLNKSTISFDFTYFNSNIENVTLTLFLVFSAVFLGYIILTYSKKPIMLQTPFKKIIFCLLISVVIYIISPNKSNDLLLFSVFPTTVLASSYVEYLKDAVLKNTVIAIIFTVSVVMFLLQL